MAYEKAQIVRSLAGHDKGDVFCILDTEGPYLLLADGKQPLPSAKRPSMWLARENFTTRPWSVSGQERKQLTARSGGRWPLSEPSLGGYDALAKDDMIEVEGVVTESLPNTTFHVDIGNGHIILAHISGKLRMNFIRILPGDKVTVQMSPYDVTRGRITWRSK